MNWLPLATDEQAQKEKGGGIMRLYLMQHGKPVPETEDPRRPLSEEGRGDANRVALFLKGSHVSVRKVCHSGKLRAKETAEIMCEVLAGNLEPEERAGLAPKDDVQETAGWLREKNVDLLICGHLPHLGKLASLMVTGDESLPIVQFQQGGVLCLQRDDEGRWSIAWMVVPDLIGEAHGKR